MYICFSFPCMIAVARILHFLRTIWDTGYQILTFFAQQFYCFPPFFSCLFVWFLTRSLQFLLVEAWMDLELVIQSECQKKTQILYINTLMWNLEKWYRWSHLQSRNRDTDLETKCMDTKGGIGGGWGELGDWDWHICTIDTVYKRANSRVIQFLAYVRELFSVLYGDLNEKEIQKYGGMHIADSLCCIVETNTKL